MLLYIYSIIVSHMKFLNYFSENVKCEVSVLIKKFHSTKHKKPLCKNCRYTTRYLKSCVAQVVDQIVLRSFMHRYHVHVSRTCITYRYHVRYSHWTTPEVYCEPMRRDWPNYFRWHNEQYLWWTLSNLIIKSFLTPR